MYQSLLFPKMVQLVGFEPTWEVSLQRLKRPLVSAAYLQLRQIWLAAEGLNLHTVYYRVRNINSVVSYQLE